jgi:hypothetical protein
VNCFDAADQAVAVALLQQAPSPQGKEQTKERVAAIQSKLFQNDLLEASSHPLIT